MWMICCIKCGIWAIVKISELFPWKETPYVPVLVQDPQRYGNEELKDIKDLYQIVWLNQKSNQTHNFCLVSS